MQGGPSGRCWCPPRSPLCTQQRRKGGRAGVGAAVHGRVLSRAAGNIKRGQASMSLTAACLSPSNSHGCHALCEGDVCISRHSTQRRTHRRHGESRQAAHRSRQAAHRAARPLSFITAICSRPARPRRGRKKGSPARLQPWARCALNSGSRRCQQLPRPLRPRNAAGRWSHHHSATGVLRRQLGSRDKVFVGCTGRA